jgi:mono/diheme cytochrome c family protein
MNMRLYFGGILTAIVVIAAGLVAAQNAAPNALIATKPIYVPDMSHQKDLLSQNALEWDATMKKTNVPADSLTAHVDFYFTNVAAQVDKTLVTNVETITYVTKPNQTGSPKTQSASPNTRIETVTNVVWVTNSITPVPVVITEVHPSCGCTTAQLPPVPWTLLPGTNSEIGVTINLAGKFGTLVKTVHVATDLGSRDLIIQVSILPAVIPKLTEAEMARQMEIAKVDRQAVFKNDCATCHMNAGQYKYGKDLFEADCGICHEAEHRASMVPDLHALKVPTNEEFWRTWIAHGKPGTFMPAFATADGGPLSDMQIASLAAYLSATIPSKIPSPQ